MTAMVGAVDRIAARNGRLRETIVAAGVLGCVVHDLQHCLRCPASRYPTPVVDSGAVAGSAGTISIVGGPGASIGPAVSPGCWPSADAITGSATAGASSAVNGFSISGSVCRMRVFPTVPAIGNSTGAGIASMTATLSPAFTCWPTLPAISMMTPASGAAFSSGPPAAGAGAGAAGLLGTDAGRGAGMPAVGV